MNDRNPDIDIDSQPIPPGMYLLPGNCLQRYAKLAKVPFGVATTMDGYKKPRTVGLIIRESDRAQMEARLAMPRGYQSVGSNNAQAESLRPYPKSSTRITKISSPTGE